MQLILWVFAIAFVLIIILLIKMRYFKHKLSWILIIFGCLFLYLTFMASISGKNIDLNSFDGLRNAGSLYFSWLGNAFSNVKTLTSNAIKMDWNLHNPFRT